MQRYSLLIVGLILVTASMTLAVELKVSQDGSPTTGGPIQIAPPAAAPGGDEATYSGTVRVYLVEPMARWTDMNGDFYHYGFLDFPVVSDFDLPDGQTLYRTGTWDAAATTIAEIFPENLMAIGVVIRWTSVLTDADPPNGRYFQARYTDAVAASTPGVVGHSQATSPFTHQIFIEEATATW